MRLHGPAPGSEGEGSPPFNVPSLRPLLGRAGERGARDSRLASGRSTELWEEPPRGDAGRRSSIRIQRRPGRRPSRRAPVNSGGPGWRRTGGVAGTWRALPGLAAAAEQRQGDGPRWRAQERVSRAWGMGELAGACGPQGSACGDLGRGEKAGHTWTVAFDGSWAAPEDGRTGWASLLQVGGPWSGGGGAGLWGGGGRGSCTDRQGGQRAELGPCCPGVRGDADCRQPTACVRRGQGAGPAWPAPEPSGRGCRPGLWSGRMTGTAGPQRGLSRGSERPQRPAPDSGTDPVHDLCPVSLLLPEAHAEAHAERPRRGRGWEPLWTWPSA